MHVLILTKKELNTIYMTLHILPLDLSFGRHLCLKRAKLPCYPVTQYGKANGKAHCVHDVTHITVATRPNWRLMSFNLSHKLFCKITEIPHSDPLLVLVEEDAFLSGDDLWSCHIWLHNLL